MSGGSKSQTTKQATTTNTLDPQYADMLIGNYNTAKTNAGLLAQPYTGQFTAGFTPTQLQAQGVLSGIGTDPTYQGYNTSAANAIKGVLGDNPNTTVTAQPVAAAQLSGTSLSPYENPYTADVINRTIADNERARQIAQTQGNQQATAAGAFGGSRSGVMGALTNEAYDRNTADQIANLNQANFSQAQAAAQGDVAAQNNMGQFNSTQNVNAQQQSIANALAQQGLKLNAAGQLVDANTAALNTAATQGGILGAVGDAQQQQQQQTALNAAYQNWLQGKQLTLDEQNLLNSAMGLIPVQQTVNSSGSGTTNTSIDPGVTGILSSVGNLFQGLGSAGLKLSDARTKEDVQTVRYDMAGRRWVSFRYKWEPVGTRHEGVIAQELLQSDPQAVHLGADGLYRVDYAALKEAA